MRHLLIAGCTLSAAVPFTFYGPAGPPPWIRDDPTNFNGRACPYRPQPPVVRSGFPGQPSVVGSCAVWSPAAARGSSMPPWIHTSGVFVAMRPSPNAVFPDHSSTPEHRNSKDIRESSRTCHAILTELTQDAKGSSSVHQHLGKSWLLVATSRSVAPPPQEVLGALLQLADEGGNVAEVMDKVSIARAASSIRDASWSTYVSHLKTVCAVCELLREPVIPATLQTIRRYTAVCNHPVTLRGHLAAWRLVHAVAGLPWAGDRDPFVRAAQAGILRILPPRLQRMAIRLDLASRIVQYCLAQGTPILILFGIMASLAYLFALRVPSELLRQATIDTIRATGEVLFYGPFRRKGLAVAQTLKRQCLCRTQMAHMCPHAWLPHLKQLSPRCGSVFASWTCSKFNSTLRDILQALGLPASTADRYSSHDFRRGCAKDMLMHSGPAAMMAHCGWKSPSSAFHYVIRDEVQESIMANMMADISDEDS